MNFRTLLALVSLPLTLAGCPNNVVAPSCMSDLDCRVGAMCVAGQCRPGSVDAFVLDAGTDASTSTEDAEPDAAGIVTVDAAMGLADAPRGDAWALDANSDAGPLLCRSPLGTCDLLMQDCPLSAAGDRQTCIYALNASGVSETQCAQILDGGGALGEPCCSLNSCDPGLACTDSVGGPSGACTTMGRCQRYCCGGTATCAPGEVCAPYNPEFAGGICDPIDRCDLVRQTGCESMPGTSCYPSSGSDPRCIRPTAAMVPVGGACMFTNDCMPGSSCIGMTVGGVVMNRCTRFCDVADGAADCPGSGTAVCQTLSWLPAGIGICPI